MNVAREVNGMVVCAEELDRLGPQDLHRRGPFVCSDCRSAYLSFYTAHKKRKSQWDDPEDTYLVKAHFKLKRGHSHEPDCPSQPRQIVTAIAGKSKPGVLTPTEDGSFRLHLNVITTELDAPAPTISDQDDDCIREPDSKIPVGIRFLPGKPLSSYVSTATHLALYYQRLKEWGGARFRDVTIIYEGRPVDWSKFFFLKAEYPDAWEVCKKTPSVRYPKAFHGEIRSVNQLANGRIAAILKGTRFPPNAKDLKEGVSTSVAPRFSIPGNWNVKLTKGLQVLVVGFAVSDTDRAFETEALAPPHNLRLINLKLKRKGQLALLG
jgi:hypothetical protein